MKGHALIKSGMWEGHDFFRKKFLKYPGPPRSIKNVPSLKKVMNSRIRFPFNTFFLNPVYVAARSLRSNYKKSLTEVRATKTMFPPTQSPSERKYSSSFFYFGAGTSFTRLLGFYMYIIPRHIIFSEYSCPFPSVS